MSAVLDRTVEQRLDALEKANRIRCARAALKAALRDGEIQAADVIAWPVHPDYLTMRVEDLLLAVPKWGPTKVRKVMGRCRISDGKTLGGMSWRQRDELDTALRSRQ